MEIAEVIKKIPLFSKLTDDLISILADKAQLKNFSPGEAIIGFGEAGRVFGAVVTGEFEAVGKASDGSRISYQLFKPWEYFGEMSLMTGEPTSADVVAVVPSSAILIPQESISQILARDPSVSTSLAKTISQRLIYRERNREQQERLREARLAQPDPYSLHNFALADGGQILTINCGSSSLKYCRFDPENEKNSLRGLVERIGLPDTVHTFERAGEKKEEAVAGDGFKAAFETMVRALGGESALGSIKAVGHRVVHGGIQYGNAVLIDEKILDGIRQCANLAPLHIPANVAGIEAAKRIMPSTPHVAVFDTGFHSTIPRHAHVYGIPYRFYEHEGVKRYGFHGTSHMFVSLQAATSLKRPFNELKIITLHLGNGASGAAINHGRCIDTSMGMTPQEGFIMGTRSGDLDPGALLHIMREHGISVPDMEKMLFKESGLLGLSGVSSDMREILKAANGGNDRALLSVQAFCYRIKKYIGAFWAALGGLDVLVFTGGIGEHSAEIRARACQNLYGIGIIIDESANRSPEFTDNYTAVISTLESPVKVLVVRTDEEKMIARETARALSHSEASKITHISDKKIPIGVSAHHVHLSRDHVETLFGKGHTLTFKSPLTQPGQFACNESVTLIGPKGKVERVRVLGPERKESQIEISRTEEFQLGIDAPIRMSGDIDGTPGLKLIGTDGEVNLEKGVICSQRHIHMTPEDALSFGIRDRDVVMVKIEGERSLIFGDVIIRVNPNFKLELHLDTDEANAAEVNTGMEARIQALESRGA